MSKRIVILGTSGSGKTTLARRLAAYHNIKHIELDLLYWKPGWKESAMPEFLARIEEEIAENDSWVMCGNYNVAKKITLPVATDIVWLNYPLYTNLWRAFKRSVKRIIRKEESFKGCPETWQHLLFNKQSILLWIFNTHNERKATYSQLLNNRNFPNANISIVTSNKEYDLLTEFKTV